MCKIIIVGNFSIVYFFESIRPFSLEEDINTVELPGLNTYLDEDFMLELLW